MQKITLILHNIRSTYNVGAIVRSAECFGVENVYATGYTPYTHSDELLDPPHVTIKMKKNINKSALGTEDILPIKKHSDVINLINNLSGIGYKIVALEQNSKSIPLQKFTDNSPIALVLGEEVHGVTDDLLSQVDTILEIPMLGKKESFNVSVATGIALYELRRKVFTEQ